MKRDEIDDITVAQLISSTDLARRLGISKQRLFKIAQSRGIIDDVTVRFGNVRLWRIDMIDKLKTNRMFKREKGGE